MLVPRLHDDQAIGRATTFGRFGGTGTISISMFLSISMFVGGLILLTVGADRFVTSAARLSWAFGIPPILIGALVIGLGTSAPELLVSALSASRGEVDIAIGNVIGSNTANITLVLGVTALITPLGSRVRILRREGVTMLAALALITGMLWNLHIGRPEAAVLLGSMVVVIVLLVVWARGDDSAAGSDGGHEAWAGTPRLEVLIGLATLGLTLAGAELLVRGASQMARDLGVSAAFVGLVVVSVGTSLPELATAVAAARRGATDLVLGNVLGSNLFNSLAVAGIAGLVGPGVIDPTFHRALVVMLVAGVIAGVFVYTGRRLERWEGVLLLVLFAVFVALSA
jgi:cation:H+ antiporter